ncbi:MAG TPA: ParB/RepB/Spo0J family partition protein [Spirochaetales bacterium]|nr:ParB/RepB/Spo0J family partition protein [Spirochaetales bacterium]
MSKKVLGKGISALFEIKQDKTAVSSIRQLPLSSISSAVYQPRKTFAEESLAELAQSIEQKGIIQPILVEESGDGKYSIVAGERRFRAAAMAGLEMIPVLVRSFSEQEKLEIALIENIQREDLTPIEEASAFKELMNRAGLSQQELAQHIGKERSTIANSLRLLKLPRHMQGAIESRNITPGHARAILSLIDNTDQETLYKEIVKQGLSVRAAEALADKLNRGIRKGEDSTKDKKPLSERRKSVELLSLEQKFIECLGTRVTIKGSDKRGKIQIDYFSLDDLERIYLLIVKEE